MRIVINHLTRMRSPRICVAGIDPRTGRHIRPTTGANVPLTREHLRASGGLFALGSVVELGRLRPRPSPPETEDHDFETGSARRVEDLDDARFLALMDRVSFPSLEDAFGPAIERIRWKYAIEPGMGERSLAVVRPRRRPVLGIEPTYRRLQLRLNDVDPPAYLPVTDLRLYAADHATVLDDAVSDVARRLRSGVGAYLMLGLARAFQATNDDRPRHWLQLNGIVLCDRALGDRP